MSTATPIDIAILKTRLQSIWSSGDYDRFSRPMEAGAREIFARLNVPAGAKLLDVACGSGQLALMAARAGALVCGVDIAHNLIQRARTRAKAEGLTSHFVQGDAESLPFPDFSFDFVVSLIGAMFAPQPDKVAAEMVRVCKPGGTIAMANWTAEGFVGKMFKVVAKYISPSGMPSPLMWGSENVVRERFGLNLNPLQLSRRFYVFDYPFSPSEVVDFFRDNYGPVNRAFAELDPIGQRKLHGEMEALWAEHNQAADGFTRVEAEYLEVIGVRPTKSSVRGMRFERAMAM